MKLLCCSIIITATSFSLLLAQPTKHFDLRFQPQIGATKLNIENELNIAVGKDPQISMFKCYITSLTFCQDDSLVWGRTT